MRILIFTTGLLALTCAAQEAPKVLSKAHFHHLHLNSTDPTAAVEFYTRKFDYDKACLQFTKVKQPPPADIVSAIWHFGWGAEDMPVTYKKQLDSGAKFQTPITDISDLVGKPNGSFYFAYVDGPDHALIELNTAAHHHFGHVHLLSEDPVAAGEWYKKNFGLTGYISREPRVYRGVHVGPMASLMVDNVNIIIFPVEYARDAMPELWKNRTNFESSKDRVVDHLAFSVDDLNGTLARLRKDGVKVTDGAFVEGPDHIRIELVQ